MKLQRVFATGLLLLISISAYSEELLSPKVVYGRDDRIEVYQTSAAWKQLASSTAALIRTSKLSPRPGPTYAIRTSNFGTDYNLCDSEPFREQNTAAFCSGFLIGPDMMATAGHCIKNESDCENTNFVFGFALNAAGEQTPDKVPAEQVYKCRKIVKTMASSENGVDFAVVLLDRAVTVATPLKMRASGTASVGDELTVIGHPVGLPTKLAANAFVRTINPGFLVASLDTYGGNSGSAVFNSKTGEVEGVLVRGETDFKYAGSCRISNDCTQDGCRGEDVTRIEFVRAAIGQ